MFLFQGIFRKVIALFRNWRLHRNHVGLILEEGVGVKNSQLGKFNYICKRAVVINSSLGDYSYVGRDTVVGNAEIGKFCSIGPRVSIGLGMHPVQVFVSTHPAFYSTTFPTLNRFADEQAFDEYGPIQIGHDVWIGANAMISDNTVIGTGAIVAAGAVVIADVAPYSIVGGVPAKEIRKRFEADQIERLLKSKWWDRDNEWLKKNHKAFHSFEVFERLIDENGSTHSS